MAVVAVAPSPSAGSRSPSSFIGPSGIGQAESRGGVRTRGVRRRRRRRAPCAWTATIPSVVDRPAAERGLDGVPGRRGAARRRSRPFHAVPGAALVVGHLDRRRNQRRQFDAELSVGALDRESVRGDRRRASRDGRRATTSSTSGVRRRADGPVRSSAGCPSWPTSGRGQLSGEAARANASLTAVQAELADEIMRQSDRVQTVASRPSAERAPYKGLLRFEPEDAELFFGREQLVADVLSRLSTDRLVVVLGASGSGKSSMVRAGVVAELRRGALPGSAPLAGRAAHSGTRPAGLADSCLVSVDAGRPQPTRAWRRSSTSSTESRRASSSSTSSRSCSALGTSERDRVAFVTALLRGIADRAVRSPSGRRRAFGLLRRGSALPGLSEAIVGSPVVVPPPTELELRRIVSLPARVAGGVVGAGSRRRGDRRLAVPLRDRCRSCRRRCSSRGAIGSTRWSRIESYRASGRGRRGDRRLGRGRVEPASTPVEQRLARSMFLRLSGGGGDVNNPVLRAELRPRRRRHGVAGARPAGAPAPRHR